MANTEIIKIYDFSIRKGTIYEVVEKLDASAPKGFRELNTTKYLFNQTYNLEPGVYFDESIKAWDTGLTESSKMLRAAIPDEKARKAVVSDLNKYIVEPIEQLQGKDRLRQTADNDEYWLDFIIPLGKGKTFNTDDPIQLYQLFLLVLGRKLTPKPLVSHPAFLKSQYVIVDREENYNIKVDKTQRRMVAIGKFYQLLSTNKDTLVNILNYIGIPAKITQDDSVLMVSFERFIDDKNNSFQNDKIFNETVDLYGTKAGAEQIFIFNKLKELHANGNKRLSIKSGDISIDGTYVSNTLKSAAEVIQSKKEFKKLYSDILE